MTEGSADVVFDQLTVAMQEMERLHDENALLHGDVDFTSAELSRLRTLVTTASQELEHTCADVERLLLQRQEHQSIAPVNIEGYAVIQHLEEENQALRMEIDVRRCMLNSLLHEAGGAAAETERLKLTFVAVSDESANVNNLADSDVEYLKKLQKVVHEQNITLHRSAFAKEQLENDEATVEEQERRIMELRSMIENCGLDVPVAPVFHRTNRLRRQRERTAGIAHNTDDLGNNNTGAVFLSQTVSGNRGATVTSLIRPQVNTTTSANNNGGLEILQRSFEIPCGWLLPLTSIVGPIRRIAAEYSLSRVVVAASPLANHITWSRHNNNSSSNGTSSRGAATYLCCYGTGPALDRFEQVYYTAMDKALLLVSRFDGLVTYQQAFGAQQQDETAKKLLEAVLPMDERHASATAQLENQNHRGSPSSSRVTLPPVMDMGHIRGKTPEASSRRVGISATPMTIIGNTPTPGRATDEEDGSRSRPSQGEILLTVQEPSGEYNS